MYLRLSIKMSSFAGGGGDDASSGGGKKQVNLWDSDDDNSVAGVGAGAGAGAGAGGGGDDGGLWDDKPVKSKKNTPPKPNITFKCLKSNCRKAHHKKYNITTGEIHPHYEITQRKQKKGGTKHPRREDALHIARKLHAKGQKRYRRLQRQKIRKNTDKKPKKSLKMPRKWSFETDKNSR